MGLSAAKVQAALEAISGEIMVDVAVGQGRAPSEAPNNYRSLPAEFSQRVWSGPSTSPRPLFVALTLPSQFDQKNHSL